MAFTVVKKLPNGQPDVIGGWTYMAVADITFDSSYATNGEPLTALELGFQPNVTIVKLEAQPKDGLVFEYDYTNKKLKAFYTTGGATAAPTTATAVPIVTTGGATASAVNATTPAVTPGVGKEVGNTANLSTITTRVVAFGCVI